MSARTTLRFAGALVATNLRASLALRGAFWLQAVFMVLNNLIFFSIWWIFFERFGELRGWRLQDLATLYGVVASGFGLAVVLAGGTRELSRAIEEGELDALLTQPKPALLQAVVSHTWAAGFGDLASGLVLLALSGRMRLGTLPAIALAIGLSALAFTASAVIVHSAAFWLGRVHSLARQVCEFLITFSMYPESLFQGGLKLLLFTALPAGLIGYLPVSLVRDFSWRSLALATGGVALLVALAALVFARGLRRYASGSRFGVRV